MRQVKKAADEHKQEHGSGGFIRYAVLKDGESGEFVFLGTPSTEPNLIAEHSFRNGKRFDNLVHRKSQCVACRAVTNGDRRVGRPALRGYFSVYDTRWSRKRLDEENSEPNKPRYKYEPLEESQVTEKGKKKGIHVRRGKSAFAFSNQWVQALVGINAQAGKRCSTCGKGKISVVGYTDAEGKPASKKAARMDEEQLETAIDSGKLVEKLKCSNCPKPIRRSIFNRMVTVSRTGEGTNTSYQFQIGDEVDDDLLAEIEEAKVEPYDFDDLRRPLSASAQAEKLGVRNPYKGKDEDEDDDAEDEAESYDDDDSDLFDDDDGDAPRRNKASKKKSKKQDDEDEDDSDDGDDENDSLEDDDDDAFEDEEEEDEEPVRTTKKKKAKKKFRI